MGLLAAPALFAAPPDTTAKPKTDAKPAQTEGARTLTAAELTSVKSTGVRQAPITIEVFSDYQCPQCRIFYLDTFHQLMDSYIASGKVYFVHRDFPLPMHSHSRDAARLATATAMLGHEQFAAVEQALYSKQDDWGSTGRVEDAVAGVLSATDMKKVRQIEAAQGSAIDAAIASDIALGDSRGVNGTPSVYVFHNGQMTPLPPGGVNYSLLKQYLDYLLQH